MKLEFIETNPTNSALSLPPPPPQCQKASQQPSSGNGSRKEGRPTEHSVSQGSAGCHEGPPMRLTSFGLRYAVVVTPPARDVHSS